MEVVKVIVKTNKIAPPLCKMKKLKVVAPLESVTTHLMLCSVISINNWQMMETPNKKYSTN